MKRKEKMSLIAKEILERLKRSKFDVPVLGHAEIKRAIMKALGIVDRRTINSWLEFLIAYDLVGDVSLNRPTRNVLHAINVEECEKWTE